jgi:hypothetical protein
MNQPWFRPRKIRLLYGQPMQLSDLSEEQILRTIEGTLHEMLWTLRSADGHLRIAPSNDRGKPSAL